MWSTVAALLLSLTVPPDGLPPSGRHVCAQPSVHPRPRDSFVALNGANPLDSSGLTRFGSANPQVALRVSDAGHVSDPAAPDMGADALSRIMRQ
jgi:hypothetical protein